MRERNFEDLSNAKIVFEARVYRARKALATDLEIISCTKVDGGSGAPARAAAVAAQAEYSRALEDAFAEYLEATTDHVPDDAEAREKFVREAHAMRLAEAEQAAGSPR